MFKLIKSYFLKDKANNCFITAHKILYSNDFILLKYKVLHDKSFNRYTIFNKHNDYIVYNPTVTLQYFIINEVKKYMLTDDTFLSNYMLEYTSTILSNVLMKYYIMLRNKQYNNVILFINLTIKIVF